MDIESILQNISFGKATEQMVRSLEDIINSSSTRFNRKRYEHLVQPPQIQDTIVAKDHLNIVTVKDHLGNVNELDQYSESIESLKKLREPNVIRIMTWNVSFQQKTTTIKDPIGRAYIKNMFDIIDTIMPTVLCVQEEVDLRIDDDDKDYVKSYKKFSAFYARIGRCNTKDGKFNSVYLDNFVFNRFDFSVVNNEVHNIQHNDDGRCGVFVNITYNDKILFSLANVQLDENVVDNGLSNIDNTIRIIDKTGIKNKIILGDMNSYKFSDYPGDLFNELQKLKGNIDGKFAVVNRLENSNFVDSFEKYFTSNNIEKENRMVPLNTTADGGRVDFIFVNKDFDLPILGCYKLNIDIFKHAPIIMDLYYSE